MIGTDVGFTGTRDVPSRAQMVRTIDLLFDLHRVGYNRFHHGDCLGSDFFAATQARSIGFRVIGHPPLNDALRAGFDSDESRAPLDYGDRNARIVEESQILIATPNAPEGASPRSGTWKTVRMARKLRRPHVVIMPSGDLVYSENWGAV